MEQLVLLFLYIVYRIKRKKAHPPYITHPPIFFVSFFDHHFIAGGTLNTTLPTGNAWKQYQTPELSHTVWWIPFTGNGNPFGLQHGGNSCTPSQWAERVCGPNPTDTCCCRASSDDHVVFLRDHPAYRYRCSCYRYPVSYLGLAHALNTAPPRYHTPQLRGHRAWWLSPGIH